jgi:hypothetical protein
MSSDSSFVLDSDYDRPSATNFNVLPYELAASPGGNKMIRTTFRLSELLPELQT